MGIQGDELEHSDHIALSRSLHTEKIGEIDLNDLKIASLTAGKVLQ